MADTLEHELTPEEMEQLTLVEESRDALSAMVEDLSSHSRRKRQTAARVIKLLAERDAAKLVPFAEELIDALYRPEAQTRWEILDALTLLMPAAGDVDFDAAYDGAEDALFRNVTPVRIPLYGGLGRRNARTLHQGVARNRRGHPVLSRRS